MRQSLNVITSFGFTDEQRKHCVSPHSCKRALFTFKETQWKHNQLSFISVDQGTVFLISTYHSRWARWISVMVMMDLFFSFLVNYLTLTRQPGGTGLTFSAKCLCVC